MTREQMQFEANLKIAVMEKQHQFDMEKLHLEMEAKAQERAISAFQKATEPATGFN
jgi:hypothetical protein